MRQMRCPAKTWETLQGMFRAAIKAVVNAKLTRSHSIHLQKSEKIFKFSTKIAVVINKLDSAGHTISRIKRKRALLRDLPNKYDVTM